MAEDKNLSDFPYTKDELLCLGIYELRDLGRDIGVPSPTTMKKEDLVDMILAIIYGEMPKRKVGKGRGRPARNKPKPNRSLIDLVNAVAEPSGDGVINDVGAIIYPSASDLYLSSKVASPTSEYIIDGSETKSNLQSGIVCVKEDRVYLRKVKYFESKEDVFVSQEMVDDYGLKAGDIVEYLTSNNVCAVRQIIKINGELAIKSKRLVNQETKESLASEDVDINPEVIIKTQKSNLVFALDEERRENIVDIVADQLESKGVAVVTVRFDAREPKKIGSGNRVEFFADSFGDEYETMAMIESGLERINYYEALETKSALIIDNLPWLMKVIDTYPKAVYGTLLDKVIKAPKNKGSKTTIVCLSSYVSNEELISLSAKFDNVCLNKEEFFEFEKDLFNKKGNK